MRALVTGHTGFSGRYLVQHLESEGHTVFGFGAGDQRDIRDPTLVTTAIQESRPDVIFHLAARRSTDLQETYSVGVLGTVNVLEAALGIKPAPKVVLVSSSAVYGATVVRRAVNERTVPRPISHHGVCKLAQEQIALRYARARGLRVVRARTFNLLGPGLSRDLACGAFVEGVVRIERSNDAPVLKTGNLAATRDFTDVRDVVRAYALLADRARSGTVFNICSGKAVALAQCVDVLVRIAHKPIRIELDPARVQPDDIPYQVGTFERLNALTGWTPSISVEQSLTDMLDHARRGAA
jgi:GDP-4-dehydro-6-deoxy-D-mannose reductase